MEQCAAEGDPVACYLTALWYRNGEGTKVDLPRSDRWLSRLREMAELGHPEAQREFGQRYRHADLLPLDIAKANYWLERSAKGGFAKAQHQLAQYLESGRYNFPVDLKRSETWYRHAFDQGHPETLHAFALREFKDGRITANAIALLRKAAAKGLRQAELLLREHIH
jgi:hypothetical protein